MSFKSLLSRTRSPLVHCEVPDCFVIFDGFMPVGLIPSVIVAVFNLILPIFFEILTLQEQWKTQLRVIQVAVLRLVVLVLDGDVCTASSFSFYFLGFFS